MNRYVAWLSQALFIVSMFSGIILVFAYYPDKAYESVQKLNYIIPFGLFIRKIHYFSSEAFLVILLLHVILEVSKNKIKVSFSSWNYSLFGLFIIFILMFSGYILKADQSGHAAADIAFTLIKETPFFSKFVILFQDYNQFYWKFFIWHIVFLPILLTYAIYKHVNTISVNFKYLIVSLALTLLLVDIINLPKDITLGIKVDKLDGPWFFLGAENLLQIGWSVVSVDLIILLPFILLCLLYKYNKIFIKALLFIWVVFYAYFSI